MEDRFEEDDREALAALPTGPRPRKGHSYSQQLRIIGIGGGGEKRGRKHSLDEDRIPKEIEYYSNSIDFNTSANNTANGSSNHGSYHRRSSSDDLSRLHSHAICITGGDPGGGGDSEPLEEFIAAGATGVLKAPIRAAVHPHRPPALELRPHPLRETQGGKFLRTIECTDTQLWAGQESGVRFWYYKDMFEPGTGLNARVRRGDEDAAPFHESGNTAPTLCMLADEGNKVIWTGHKDGKIRSWKMDILVQSSSSDKLSSLSTASAAPFKEGLSWQAHKGPVLSLVISAYGDIWTGSEGGAIRVWPWESVGKSLALSPDERHMAALLVERSVVDLRSQVTVNGVCHISSSEVKAMLSDYARGKVWCAGQSSFSLWDARTKELLKVFNTEGQIENRADMPTNSLEQTIEDEMKVKFVAPPKKEKSPGFLQRSRNAIMGAADAVRRVATRGTGAFNEDLKKTESLVMTPDGMIWSGCSNGTLIQWDGNGNRLQDFTHHASPVLCFCTHGSRLWIGYASGMVQMLDLNGNAVTGWISHSSPIVKLALGGGYVYSLAAHGGLRAWNLTSPGPLDGVLRTELAATETLYTKREQFKILVGTWNVSQGKPSLEALKLWLSSSASDAGIVVVGLQEVEMGAGFLAMSAAKETVGLEGSAIGQLWQDAIGKAIEEGPTFERVGSRQLAALLICIWVRKSLRVHVGDLDVAAVACGLGRTIGNKGGVGLRLRVYNRIFCFVNCHLAAHLEAVNRRNADFDHIFRTMVFTRQSNLLNVAAAAGGSNSNASQGGRSTNSESGKSEEGRPDLSQADMVIFFGDFNYRLKDITYDEARDLVSQRSFDWLREKDQLRAEMGAGKVFQGMREAIITFPPTYKFEKHIPGLGGYDSGEKKRIPAWCDRIIYRDNRTVPRVNECSLDCPVISSIQQYDACMEVTESDHKPVRCKLNVHLAHVDRSVRRKEFGNIMKSNDEIKRLLHELSKIPETMISTDNIVLQNQETFSLRITNKSDNDMAAYRIICEGQYSLNDGDMSTPRPRCSFGFPSWLEVAPAAGILNADHTVDITVRHIEIQASGDSVEGGVPQNWWSEDTKDKEVVLRVCITGMSSTEVRIHRVQVHHSFTSKTNSHEPSRSEGSKKRPGGNPDTVDRG